MRSRLRPKLSYSNVIASLALFIALGGAAVAAGLPKHSVGPQQLKRGAVTTNALRKNAVRSGKIAPKAIVAGKLGPSSVLPGNLVNGGITTAKIAEGAIISKLMKNGIVTTNKLKNGGVTNEKLAANAVTTNNIANGSVTLAKLAEEVAPLLGTLKSGQTLRGVFDVGGSSVEGATPEQLARDSTSFQFPLLAKPATVTPLKKGEVTANCTGLSGGNAETPQAAPGSLCVYLTEEFNLDETAPIAVENSTRLGFGLVARAKDKEKAFYGYGQWAVTAP
jgi:hypothetical protein